MRGETYKAIETSASHSFTAAAKEQKRYLTLATLLGDEKIMSFFPLKQRFKIALGGFACLVGFMMLLFALLTTTGTLKLETVMKNEIIVAVAVTAGIIDIICGYALFRKK